MILIKFTLIPLFLFLIASNAAQAQRDAPVWNCYLSPITVSAEDPNLSISFVLHKDGGPHEHIEQQGYVLLYLKAEERVILDAIRDADYVNKATQAKKAFLNDLTERKLCAKLETKVSKKISDDDREEMARDSGYRFPFEFQFDTEKLYQHLKSNTKFDETNTTISGKSTWYKEKFGLIVFAPVNDSIYADQISDKLTQTDDFANVMNTETSILYFKPLPYEFSFKRHEEKLIVYIN